MPQITLEYSSNVKAFNNIESLIINVHKVIESQCSTNINSCKTRIMPIEDFVIGDGTLPQKFLHLEIKLYEGRPQEIITSLGNSLVELLKTHENLILQNPELGITVHIIDIERKKYFKYSSD